MRVLVTGGAGYIGSITTHVLQSRGIEPVVLDNLSNGHRFAVPGGVPFFRKDLRAGEDLADFIAACRVDAVVHFAGFIEVGESVRDPMRYYRNNVSGTVNLLSAMQEAGIRRFVFSSSAAVYGNPQRIPIDEEHPVRPINPYGWSKAMVEQMLKDSARSWGLSSVSLRYFNAAGALPGGTMGEDHPRETHLIPRILRAALEVEEGGDPIRIFGTDYDTPDGTCIRDYIHVVDLAEAHVAALEWRPGRPDAVPFNLGNERGFSVREIVRVCEEVTGVRIPVEEAPRRPGDPPVLVASSRRIRSRLGWSPRYPDIREIVRSAWEWHRSHPRGYSGPEEREGGPEKNDGAGSIGGGKGD